MAAGASPEEADDDALENMPMTHMHNDEAGEAEEDVVNLWLNLPEDDSEATGIQLGGSVVDGAVAPIAAVAEGDAKVIGIEHGGAVVGVAVAPIAEEAEDDAKATEIEHGGAVVVAAAVALIADETGDDAKATEIVHGDTVADAAVAPIAEVVESQEKSGQTEKGKEITAEVDSEKTTKFEVGEHVTCLSTRTNLYLPAQVVRREEAKAGLEYYVHYIDSVKRLDEWLPSTLVKKCYLDFISPSKCLYPHTLTSPAKFGSGTSADTQRDTTGTLDRMVTRNLRKRLDGVHVVPKPKEELAQLDQSLEKEHSERTEVKVIEVVELGKYEIDTWYFSPYHEKYQKERLYICEYCLKYMRKKRTIEDHKMECKHPKHPPGDEIYKSTAPILKQVRDSEGTLLKNTPSTSGTESITSESVQHLSMYEVDGTKSKLYCQVFRYYCQHFVFVPSQNSCTLANLSENLCLLAGLFLDHKQLFYGVDSFVFYILTENDASGNHLVAYFSKEKDSADDYNVACILTLPPFQRKGYGSFLIAFAYELSKKEGKVGTPESPLSDLGLVSFRSYWKRVLLETLRNNRDLSIEDLSTKTSISINDIIIALRPLTGLITYWKGEYCLNSVSKRLLDDILKTMRPAPDWIKIDASKLQWAPETAPTTRRPK